MDAWKNCAQYKKQQFQQQQQWQNLLKKREKIKANHAFKTFTKEETRLQERHSSLQTGKFTSWALSTYWKIWAPPKKNERTSFQICSSRVPNYSETIFHWKETKVRFVFMKQPVMLKSIFRVMNKVCSLHQVFTRPGNHIIWKHL